MFPSTHAVLSLSCAYASALGAGALHHRALCRRTVVGHRETRKDRRGTGARQATHSKIAKAWR